MKQSGGRDGVNFTFPAALPWEHPRARLHVMLKGKIQFRGSRSGMMLVHWLWEATVVLKGGAYCVCSVPAKIIQGVCKINP